MRHKLTYHMSFVCIFVAYPLRSPWYYTFSVVVGAFGAGFDALSLHTDRLCHLFRFISCETLRSRFTRLGWRETEGERSDCVTYIWDLLKGFDCLINKLIAYIFFCSLRMHRNPANWVCVCVYCCSRKHHKFMDFVCARWSSIFTVSQGRENCTQFAFLRLLDIVMEPEAGIVKKALASLVKDFASFSKSNTCGLWPSCNEVRRN